MAVRRHASRCAACVTTAQTDTTKQLRYYLSMIHFRRTLILLLIAVIPLQGIAAFNGIQARCVMHDDSMTSAMHHADMHAVHMPSTHAMNDGSEHCCSDDAMPAQHCQAGHDCHVTQPSMAAAADVFLVVYPEQHCVVTSIPFKPLPTLIAIWRPPSLTLFA